MLRRSLFCIVALALVAPATAFGGPFTIDQSLSGALCGQGCAAVNIGYVEVTHQTFIPTLSAMDAVEIWVGDMYDSDDNPTTLRMSIRSGGIDGTLLGSVDVVVPDPPRYDRVPVHFDFATRIALIPGDTYALELSAVGGETFGLGIAYAGDGYASGQAYYRGTASDGDWYFSEGLHPVSTPDPGSSLLLLGIGLAGLRAWRWRRG